MALKDTDPFDLILTGLAKLHKGGIEDCSQFLDTIFGFLARKTHFYTASSTVTARKMILDKFQTYGADAIKSEQKKKKELNLSKRRKKGVCEATSNISSKIQKLTTAEEAETHKQQKLHEKEGSINKISAHDSSLSSSRNTAQAVSKNIIDVGDADFHNFSRSQNLSDSEIRWSFQVPGFPLRSEHVVVAVENAIYSFGGFTKGDNPLYSPDGPLDVFVLNVNESKMKWRILPTQNNELLNQRCPYSAVVYKDSVLILGGRDANTKKISDSIHSLNAKTLKWDKVKVTGNIPIVGSFHTAVVVGEQLIFLCGSGFWLELYSLYLGTFHWFEIETKGFSPYRRCSYSATVYNEKIYIFSGWVPGCEFNYNLNDLLCFDVHSKEWTVPEAEETTIWCHNRKDHSAFLHNGQIFVFGGSANACGSLLCNLVSYDSLSCKWKEIKPIGYPPSPRSYFGCVALANKVFVFGGESGFKDFFDDTFVLEMGNPMVRKPQIGENVESVTTKSILAITSSPLYSIASQIDSAEIHAGDKTQTREENVGERAKNTNATNQDTAKSVEPRSADTDTNNKMPSRKNKDSEIPGSSRNESSEKVCLEGASIRIISGIDKVKIESDYVPIAKIEPDDSEKKE